MPDDLERYSLFIETKGFWLAEKHDESFCFYATKENMAKLCKLLQLVSLPSMSTFSVNGPLKNES